MVFYNIQIFEFKLTTPLLNYAWWVWWVCPKLNYNIHVIPRVWSNIIGTLYLISPIKKIVKEDLEKKIWLKRNVWDQFPILVLKRMTLFIQKVTTKVTLQMEIFKLGMDSRLVFGLIYQIYFIKNPANLRSQLPSTVR